MKAYLYTVLAAKEADGVIENVGATTIFISANNDEEALEMAKMGVEVSYEKEGFTKKKIELTYKFEIIGDKEYRLIWARE